MAKEGPLYPNQPLREVATEVRFRGDLSIENIRAVFQKKINSEYPVLKAPGAQQGVAPSLQPFRFETECGRSGVQVAINSISYFTRDYPGYVAFMRAFEPVTKVFFGLLGPVNTTRIGWRYINAIPFTRENGLLPLSRIFKDNDIYGNSLSLETDQLSTFLVKSFDDFRLNIKLESTTPASSLDEEVIILDIDAFQEFKPDVAMNDQETISVIRHMHDASRSVFENLISDGYREFLKGGENE
ncbi:MAG: TIGR04255 family protein [Candidatus Thiodiazotropha sp. (ex Troendleina suluensis)]|nr:TIGR04255 family protein [Candidatus Thiodiazotropha sp. (ex Troendleina suluensis)]